MGNYLKFKANQKKEKLLPNNLNVAWNKTP